MPMYFNALIKQSSLEETAEKKTPSVCLWLELIPNDKDGFLPDGVDAAQYAHLWLTEKTIGRTNKTLRDLGWQGKDLLELHYSNPLECVSCNVTCDFEEYNGKKRFRVMWVNAARAVKDIGDGKQFTVFNRYFADGQEGSAAAKSTPTQQPTTNHKDEGLPF